jgi:2-keto-3-deoxy-galactonokinase
MQVSPIEVQKHLKGLSYPATKDDVVSTAQRNGADEELISELRGLDKEEFSGPDDVMRALGSS